MKKRCVDLLNCVLVQIIDILKFYTCFADVSNIGTDIGIHPAKELFAGSCDFSL